MQVKLLLDQSDLKRGKLFQLKLLFVYLKNIASPTLFLPGNYKDFNMLNRQVPTLSIQHPSALKQKVFLHLIHALNNSWKNYIYSKVFPVQHTLWPIKVGGVDYHIYSNQL